MAKPTPEEIAKLTPMMRQYFELKEQAQGAIVFFRMGDFYELFGEDAENVAPVLDIVLTSRSSGGKNKIPFCGVPHHSVHGYLLKLLSKGYKVAVVDQLEEASSTKGLVKRGIVRIYTPGCVDELEGLPKDSQNYLMAAYECPENRTWSVSVTEVSTGEIRLGGVKSFEEVTGLIEAFRPKELLCRQFQTKKFSEALSSFISDNGLLIEAFPEEAIRDESVRKDKLKRLLGRAGLKKQPCGEVASGEINLASVFLYIENLKADTSQFMFVRPLKEPDTVMLSDIAIRDLELFETARRRKVQGSLFHTINRTLSPMGARLLRWNLARPLFNKSEIEKRHQAIEAITKLGERTIDELRLRLKGTPDLERIATRILSGKVSPLELSKARETLDKASWLFDTLTHHEKTLSKSLGKKNLFEPIIKNLKSIDNARTLLHERLCEVPGPMGTGVDVIRPGFSKSLDEISELVTKGEQKIADYESSLREQTGITSLKVKSHKTFGLLLEVTKSNLSKVPDHFVRRQTMVNCERFITDELKELDDAISSAGENAVRMEGELYIQLLKDLSSEYKSLMNAAESLAMFDMLLSFAFLSVKEDYVRPTINDGSHIKLLGSRHPVVESITGKNHYVPNNIDISSDKKQLLITGPNMAGKSTVMRQVAVTAIIVQAGGFAPSHTADLPIFDQIFTRVGASDDLAKGQSTFMVEMSEAAHILRSSTDRSLVILDEVGRGTSTEDGLAIASAILEDIATRTKSWALFATHYHELVPLSKNFESIRTVQTEVLESKDGITFTHKLIEGASGSSFGVEVAKIAGLPDHVIKAAGEYLVKNSEVTNRNIPPAESPRQGASADIQERPVPSSNGQNQAIEPEKTEVIAELERLNINKLTPLAALNLLDKWQSELSKPAKSQQGSLFESIN